jgi:hypothetical protein
VTNQGGADIFAMKFAPTGELVSAWQRGTPVDDLPTSMAVDHCGNVFVGGFTASALLPGHASAGGEDMLILRASF